MPVSLHHIMLPHAVDDYYPSDYGSGESLELVCAGGQGHHEPLWFTDIPTLQDDQGAVTCDNPGNNQLIDSSYTTRYIITSLLTLATPLGI